MSGRPFGLRLYAAVCGALSPFAGLVLAARARAGKEDPGRLAERFGRASLARPGGRLVWLHGASVGESLSLLALAESFSAAPAATTVLLTSGTRTAAEVLARRLPAGVLHQYAPLDTPRAARRFAGHWRPDLAVFVESDLWPNLIFAAKAHGARLALVSARLSPASARRWRLVGGAARALFGAFDLILARDEAAAATLRTLGANVDGLADAKLAAPPLPADAGEARRLRAELGGRRVIVAASTHPGEEAMILARFAAVAVGAKAGPLLVVIPRHPDRGGAVEDLARGEGLVATRRTSQGAFVAGLDRVDVHVSSTVGELGLWYRLADLVILGGSLVDGVGGHNPLEPARLGRAILVGPYTDAWPIYGDLEGAGGCVRLADAAALDPWIGDVADSRGRLAVLGSRAVDFAARRDAQAASDLDRVFHMVDP